MQRIYNIDSSIKKAIIVVAHADDETIFMGGTILNHKDWEWYLYVLAYRNDKNFDKSQLYEVIKSYEGLGINIKLCEDIMEIEASQDDEYVSQQNIRESIEHLKGWMKNKKEEIESYIIFTHNREGEYGHQQHKKVNKYVNELFPDNTIWEFISPCANNVVPQPFKKDIVLMQLSQKDLDNKRKIYSHYITEQGNWINDLSNIMLYQFGSGPEIFTKD